MFSLGLTTMGTSAAALFENGRLLAAVEEERLTRIKNDGAFPRNAIAECLRLGGIAIGDVAEVCVYWQRWRLGQRARGTLAKAVGSREAARGVAGRAAKIFLAGAASSDRPEDTGSWRDLFRLTTILKRDFPGFAGKVRFVDHHMSHMLYAEAMRDWADFVSLSYDGGGESNSSVIAVVRGGRREHLPPHRWPNSLGHFYSFFTGFLGFRMLEGEYKLMGLAPYGRPVFAEALKTDFLKLLPDGRYRLNTRLCDYHSALKDAFSPEVDRMLCPRRPRDADPTPAQIDLAASVQKVFEEAQQHVLRPVRAANPDLGRLVVSGGCALNVTANGRLLQSGLFEEIIVPPAPHDAGCAIGAVLVQRSKTGASLSARDRDAIRSPYLGAAYDDEAIAMAASPQCRAIPDLIDEAGLIAATVRLLVDGFVVAWFQGRAEFGPRALGARSFLADPRKDSIRDALNAKIKKRELFRPFAPSVTVEAAPDYFELDQESPYMNVLARVRDDKAALIPAVTHIDRTARVHTVTPAANPLYHRLLSAFGAETGVPVLLNTSFNIQEPIVYDPEQAFATFARSGVDALVIGRRIFRREHLA